MGRGKAHQNPAAIFLYLGGTAARLHKVGVFVLQGHCYAALSVDNPHLPFSFTAA